MKYGQACDLPEEYWLGKKDSNLRMPESKSGALTNLATPQRVVYTGSRANEARILQELPLKIQCFVREKPMDAR